MRIVVTGAGGQLGSELIESATRRGHDVIATTRVNLDVTNRDETISVIREIRPDVIMHAAAWTAVDACESDRDRAMRDNGEATRNVVEAARASGAKVYDVVGPVCESGDWLARDRTLAMEEGDLLAIMSAGAYGMVMSSNYNTRPRAAEILVDGSKTHLVRARETVESLYAGEHVIKF